LAPFLSRRPYFDHQPFDAIDCRHEIHAIEVAAAQPDDLVPRQGTRIGALRRGQRSGSTSQSGQRQNERGGMNRWLSD
jgi:hypothetical protein